MRGCIAVVCLWARERFSLIDVLPDTRTPMHKQTFPRWATGPTLRAIALAPLMVAAATTLGSLGCKTEDSSASRESIQIDLQRFRVALSDDDIALGGEHPLVTIVVFSDYACGPCGRTWNVMSHLVEHYGEDLRVVFRASTVPGFEHGDRATDAAFAAGAQGKFWEMHWKLFQDQDSFSRPSLRAHATEIGLDVPRFMDDLDSGAFTSARLQHRRQAQQLGLSALPVAFVNGLYVLGFHDEEGWRALIDQEIQQAKKMVADGTPRPKIYETIMATALVGRVAEAQQAKELREKQAEAEQLAAQTNVVGPDGSKRYRIDHEGEYGRIGPQDAPVEIVEFLDFQCPYCKRSHREVLVGLREKYGDQITIVIRQLPLEIHAAALSCAKASLAALRQGKFAEFHDALLSDDQPAGRGRFVELATGLGLDTAKFSSDLDDPTLATQIQTDLAVARRLGVTGTPGFFVNGRFIDGLQPSATFEQFIDEDLAKAKAMAEGGTRGAEIRAALMQDAIGSEGYPNP